MKITAREIHDLGVIDEVIAEPLGGAHHDYDVAAGNLKKAIIKHLEKLMAMSGDAVRADRQKKFREIGAFHEATA